MKSWNTLVWHPLRFPPKYLMFISASIFLGNFTHSIWQHWYRLNRKKGSFISIFYIMFKIKTQVKIQNRRWYRAGKLGLMLYILTGVWVLRTPNAGWNLHSKRFCAKKLKKAKKQEICIHFLEKTGFFNTELVQDPSKITFLLLYQLNLCFGYFNIKN